MCKVCNKSWQIKIDWNDIYFEKLNNLGWIEKRKDPNFHIIFSLLIFVFGHNWGCFINWSCWPWQGRVAQNDVCCFFSHHDSWPIEVATDNAGHNRSIQPWGFLYQSHTCLVINDSHGVGLRTHLTCAWRVRCSVCICTDPCIYLIICLKLTWLPTLCLLATKRSFYISNVRKLFSPPGWSSLPQNSLLRWKMIIVPIPTTSLIHSCPRSLAIALVAFPPVHVCWAYTGTGLIASSLPTAYWRHWPSLVSPVGKQAQSGDTRKALNPGYTAQQIPQLAPQ